MLKVVCQSRYTMKLNPEPGWLFWTCVYVTVSFVAEHSVAMRSTTVVTKHDSVTRHDYVSWTVKQRRKIVYSTHTAVMTENNLAVTPVTIPPSPRRNIAATSNSPLTPAEHRKALQTTTDSSPLSRDKNITIHDHFEMKRGPKKNSLKFLNAWSNVKKFGRSVQASVTHQRDLQASVTHQRDLQASVTHQRDLQASVTHQRDLQASVTHQRDLQASVTHQREVEEATVPFQVATEDRTSRPPHPDVSTVTDQNVLTSVDTVHATSKVRSIDVPAPNVSQTMTMHQDLSPTDHPMSESEKHVPSFSNSTLANVKFTKTMAAETTPSEPTAESQRAPDIVQCNYLCCGCDCKSGEAKCAAMRACLHSLPQLPACIRDFYMVGADLVSLTRHMLANLSNFNITAMRLPSNRISRLDPDTFADFHYLEVLDLSNNQIPVTQVWRALEQINTERFRSLNLDQMGLTALPDDFFKAFTNRSLTKVSLKQNQLQSFDSVVFHPFWAVVYVELSMNNIFRVNISTRLGIQVLKLRDNNFLEFPDFCLHQSATTVTNAFYNLRGLYVGSRSLPRIPSSRLRGVCFPHLVKLDISASDKLYKLENNFIADLPKLEYLLVSEMRQLRFYEPLAFNSSSLKKLKLSDNMNIGEATMSREYMLSFDHCPNLEKLWIVNTVVRFHEEIIWRLLLPLTKLRGLYLRAVSKYALPLNLLWRFSKLEELDLRANGITSGRLGLALQNVTSLRILKLQSNRITVVNESSLPWPFRQHLSYLDLSKNPFSCSCEQRWFKRWLDGVTHNHSVKVNDYPSRYSYICDSPPAKRGLSLADLHLTDEECTALNLGLLLGVSGTSLLALISLVLALAYRYRWYLRFYLYRCRRRRQERERDELLLYQYDVYLAYSPGDLDWVCEELLPLLEQDCGLHTFLLDRDTVPGTIMADNITKFMDKSARILLLLSDTYTREQWRLYEFEHIVYAAIDQQKDVIVVLLGDVNAGRMTKNMRRMLTRGTFLQWDSSSEEAQRVFRDGLRVALKTEDTGFHTLC